MADEAEGMVERTRDYLVRKAMKLIRRVLDKLDELEEEEEAREKKDEVSKESAKLSPCEAVCSKSKAIGIFLAMGFDEEKVIKAIHEHGEDNMEQIAHTLLSSASTEELYDQTRYEEAAKFAVESPQLGIVVQTFVAKLQSSCEARRSKSKAIGIFLAMGFDEKNIIKAIHEHGEDNMEQIAHTLLSSAKDSENSNQFQSLVKMGFSKKEASLALERCDENVGIDELADFICADQMAREFEEHKAAPPQHQVFINFRGELRNNFISHLVEALRRNKIKVFIDYQEPKGEDISILLKRIEDSRIALAVFSSKYTGSTWCLREAEKIKGCVQQGMLKVLPIFYNVTTTDVKQLKGEFGNHFRDREYESRYDKSRIERWKEALAFISGKLGLTFDEKSISECDFIRSIVKEVLGLLAKIPSTAESVNS